MHIRRSDLQDLGGGAGRVEGKNVRPRCNKEYTVCKQDAVLQVSVSKFSWK